MTKIKKIESENFIIPKKKDEEEEKKAGDAAQAQESAESQPNAQPKNSENDLAAILQNELRDLHFKLRQKDQIIQEFKKEAQAYYSQKIGTEGAMTARTSKFAQLIQSDQSQEQSSRQQTDHLLDLITNGEEPITEEQMNAWNSNFVLLTAKDLKSLMQNKNSIIEARQTLMNAKA